MMERDVALIIGLKRCKDLVGIITRIESQSGRMDSKHRAEMGAWRRCMHDLGIPRSDLPETPFLEPARLEAWKAYKERNRQERAA